MIFFHFIYILILSFYFCFYSSMECEILLWSYTIHLPKGDNSMITNITKFFHRWSFSMGGGSHEAFAHWLIFNQTYLFVRHHSCSYKECHTFDNGNGPEKILPLILWSFTFTTEIGSYIWPKLKNRISSTCVRIFTSFILILLRSSYIKNRISPSWKVSLIFM